MLDRVIVIVKELLEQDFWMYWVPSQYSHFSDELTIVKSEGRVIYTFPPEGMLWLRTILIT
jgi:hypothetical protein